MKFIPLFFKKIVKPTIFKKKIPLGILMKKVVFGKKQILKLIEEKEKTDTVLKRGDVLCVANSLL